MSNYAKRLAESIGKSKDFTDDKRIEANSLKQLKRNTNPLTIKIPHFGFFTDFLDFVGILDRTNDN
jgi:hypothetical protein